MKIYTVYDESGNALQLASDVAQQNGIENGETVTREVWESLLSQNIKFLAGGGK